MLFPSFIEDSLKGRIDLTGSFKCMLVTDQYVPSTSHSRRSDVSNEIVGPGYAVGGAPIVLTSVVDTALQRVAVNFGTVDFLNSTITARGAVIYRSRGGAATADELVIYLDFGTDVFSTQALFRCQVSTPLYILTTLL